MASITAQAPDGASLNIDIPPGTDPSNYEDLVHDAVGHYTANVQTPMESGARGALRNFPLAQQLTAASAPINPFTEKNTYSEEMSHLNKKGDEAKEQNKGAYYTGAGLATIAPFMIPGAGLLGTASKGLSAGLESAPVLGNAALGIIQSQSDTDLTKPTMENAKDAAIAGLIGGATGGAGRLIKNLAPSTQALEAKAAAKGLDITGRQVRQITGKDPEAQMAELGRWIGTKTNEKGEPLVQILKNSGDRLNQVQKIQDVVGKQIGSIVDTIDEKMPVAISRLKQELTPILEGVTDINPQSEAKISGIFTRLDKLEKSGKTDFHSLQKLKSNVGASIGDDPAMKQAYGVVAEYMDNVVEAYGKYIKDPALHDMYTAAKIDYKNSSNLLHVLKTAESKDIASGPMGNAGLGGIASLIGGVATGHPIAGVAGALGASVGRPIANMVGRNALLKSVPHMPGIVQGSKKLTQAAELELANALQSQFGQKKK